MTDVSPLRSVRPIVRLFFQTIEKSFFHFNILVSFFASERWEEKQQQRVPRLPLPFFISVQKLERWKVEKIEKIKETATNRDKAKETLVGKNVTRGKNRRSLWSRA